MAEGFQKDAFQNDAFQVDEDCIQAFQPDAFQFDGFQVCEEGETPEPQPRKRDARPFGELYYDYLRIEEEELLELIPIILEAIDED